MQGLSLAILGAESSFTFESPPSRHVDRSVELFVLLVVGGRTRIRIVIHRASFYPVASNV